MSNAATTEHPATRNARLNAEHWIAVAATRTGFARRDALRFALDFAALVSADLVARVHALLDS